MTKAPPLQSVYVMRTTDSSTFIYCPFYRLIQTQPNSKSKESWICQNHNGTQGNKQRLLDRRTGQQHNSYVNETYSTCLVKARVLPFWQAGTEPFHFPCLLQYNVFVPAREYPFLQLKWSWDPSTEPLPLTKPFGINEGRTGQSADDHKTQRLTNSFLSKFHFDVLHS